MISSDQPEPLTRHDEERAEQDQVEGESGKHTENHAFTVGLAIYELCPVLDRTVRRPNPVVIVDEPDLGVETSFVGIDDRAGAAMAAEHLLGLGHRRIGVVLGRLGAENVPTSPITRAQVHLSPVRIARARLRESDED